MKNIIYILIVLGGSFCFQTYLKLTINIDFISVILTVFSIIFGFYITSFAVFSTSKYLSKLYKIEKKDDNRKTLLDVLLEEFSLATYFLLTSIIYLVLIYIFIENNYEYLITIFPHFIWGVIFLNIFYVFRTISIFIQTTRQSAKIE